MQFIYILLFCFSAGLAHASLGVFEKLRNLSHKSQAVEAYSIYKDLIKEDSIAVIHAISELERFSHSIKNNELEIIALNLLSRYYFYEKNDSEKGIEYCKETVELAALYGEKRLEAMLTNVLGNMHTNIGEMIKGFEYLLRSDRLMQDVGYENINNAQYYLSNIGWAYYYFENYPRAMYYLEKILENVPDDSETAMMTYLRMGILQQKMRKYDEAITSYQKALELANVLEDSINIGSISGNIGDLYANMGNFEAARPLFLIDEELARKHDNMVGLSGALLYAVRLDIHDENFAAAKSKLEEAYTIMKKEEISFDGFWDLYYEQTADLLRRKGDFIGSHLYQDSLIWFRDSIKVKKDANLMTGVETMLMTEKHLSDLAILNEEKRREKLIRNVTWVIFGMTMLLLIGIIYGLIFRQKRLQQKQKILQLENQKAENMLEAYLDNIRKKNKLIEDFRHEIDELRKGLIPRETETREKALNDLYNSTILTEEDWVNFKRLFEKVHKGFFSHIKNQHPELTLAETRLLTLLKLNLTPDEAANMLGISRRSLNRTSQRLRKKLNLADEEALMRLLSEI